MLMIFNQIKDDAHLIIFVCNEPGCMGIIELKLSFFLLAVKLHLLTIQLPLNILKKPTAMHWVLSQIPVCTRTKMHHVCIYALHLIQFKHHGYNGDIQTDLQIIIQSTLLVQ